MKNRKLVSRMSTTEIKQELDDELMKGLATVAALDKLINARTASTPTEATHQK